MYLAQLCVRYDCMHLTIGGRRRFPGLWFDCGATGAGSWTHSCWSVRNQEMGREWSTGCSGKLKGHTMEGWREKGNRKEEQRADERRNKQRKNEKENRTGNRWREWWLTEEKKDKRESDNKCVGLLILIDTSECTHRLPDRAREKSRGQ